MLRLKCCEDFIHRLLIAIHTPTDPQIVVLFPDRVIRWERCHRGHLFELLNLFGELVLHEDAAFRGTEIGAALLETLLIKGLMDDADSGAAAD